MSKKSPADNINDAFDGKVESVKGPPGAPIGFNVHGLSIEGGNPFARKHNEEEQPKGNQHQPIVLDKDVPAPRGFDGPVDLDTLSHEMQYRTEMGNKGVRAVDANLDKLISKGMTPGPKVRFDNSILASPPVAELDPNFKGKPVSAAADPNAGAPKDP